MKFRFGVSINILPDFLDGKEVTLLGYTKDNETVKVEVSNEEIVINRKKIRDSYFETQVALKKPKEKKWEKYIFPTLSSLGS